MPKKEVNVFVQGASILEGLGQRTGFPQILEWGSLAQKGIKKGQERWGSLVDRHLVQLDYNQFGHSLDQYKGVYLRDFEHGGYTG